MPSQTIRMAFTTAPNHLLRMSRTRLNYWAEFGLDIPLGAALIVSGLRQHGLSVGSVVLTVVAGLLLFSFLEYAVHRWLFHGSIRVVVQGHGEHHKNPQGYDALPFFLPSLVILAFTGLFALLLPLGNALLLSGVMACGYVTYGLGHFTIHHTHFRQPLARRWAAHHLIHHYHAGTNFGVTTPLWDLLIGTQYVHHRTPV